MAVYDVNGDGLNDVVTSLQAHGLGLSWFEQKKAADGSRSFVERPIMSARLRPNICSAAWLNSVIAFVSSMMKIPSRAMSRIAALRAAQSRAYSSVRAMLFRRAAPSSARRTAGPRRAR